MTVTSGTIADTNAYTWESTAYANNVTLTLVDASTGATVNANITITTGAGADTVSVTCANWVGAATAAPGRIVIATGSGNDTITVATGTLLAVSGTSAAVTITAGTGADTITVTSHANATAQGNFSFVVTAGDSNTTAYDQITGFRTALGGATISDGIDFTGTSAVNVYTATAATGYTASQLTVAVASTGIVTLAGTAFTAGLTLQQTIDAVQSVVNTVNGDTCLFTYSTAGVTSTFIFNNNTVDSVVQLVGVSTATALITSNGTTAGNIFIA
jgi:hypothetical protein